MEVAFVSDDLARLAQDPQSSMGFDKAVEKKYRQRIAYIAAANDERDLYALKSLHYEKLRGDREHQHSMRLNDQWRLILEIHRLKERKVVVVVDIEDYH